ncbi:MAG: alpha/beta fold hydrolase [Patescibacteria group bacterium]
MKNCKVIVVHGMRGSSKTDFFPALAEEFRKKNIDFVIPDMPGGILNRFPWAPFWLRKIHEEVSATKKPVIFVGFSLGTRAILLYLEKYQIHVKGLVLVAAPPNMRLAALAKQGRVASFFMHKINPENILPLVDTCLQIHSKDDPKVSYKWGLHFSKEFKTKLTTFKDRGHFSKAEHASDIVSILEKELM